MRYYSLWMSITIGTKRLPENYLPKHLNYPVFFYFRWPPQIKNVMVASKIVKASPQSKIGAQNSSFLFSDRNACITSSQSESE